jgi:hypothetical protein
MTLTAVLFVLLTLVGADDLAQTVLPEDARASYSLGGLGGLGGFGGFSLQPDRTVDCEAELNACLADCSGDECLRCEMSYDNCVDEANGEGGPVDPA